MTNSIIGKKSYNGKSQILRVVLLNRKPLSGKLHPSTLPGSYIPALVKSIGDQDFSIFFFLLVAHHTC